MSHAKQAWVGSWGTNFYAFQASLRGKVSEFDAYVLMLHKNALQVLVPTIGQQLTLYLDSREKKKEEKKNPTKAEPMEVDETSAPKFEFNEKVTLLSLQTIITYDLGIILFCSSFILFWEKSFYTTFLNIFTMT